MTLKTALEAYEHIHHCLGSWVGDALKNGFTAHPSEVDPDTDQTFSEQLTAIADQMAQLEDKITHLKNRTKPKSWNSGWAGAAPGHETTYK